jgi:hypothetical protein
VPIVNGDSKAEPDSELRSFLEELLLRYRCEFRLEINAPSEGFRGSKRLSNDGIDN